MRRDGADTLLGTPWWTASMWFAIRIEQERRVVAGVIGALAGGAAVGGAGGQPGGMELLDRGAIACLKGEVDASGQAAGGVLALGWISMGQV